MYIWSGLSTKDQLTPLGSFTTKWVTFLLRFSWHSPPWKVTYAHNALRSSGSCAKIQRNSNTRWGQLFNCCFVTWENLILPRSLCLNCRLCVVFLELDTSTLTHPGKTSSHPKENLSWFRRESCDSARWLVMENTKQQGNVIALWPGLWEIAALARLFLVEGYGKRSPHRTERITQEGCETQRGHI